MIYSGTQAQALGLVDEIAYTDDALKAMKTAYGLEDAEVFDYASAWPVFRFFLVVRSGGCQTDEPGKSDAF